MLKSWAAFHTRPLLFANVSTGALPASMGKDLRTWAGAFNGTISEVRRCFVTGLLALIFMVQLVSRFYVHHFTIDSKRLNYYQLWLQWLVHLRLKSIVIPLLKYLTNFDPISLTMGISFDYNASIILFGWVPICGFIPYSIMIYRCFFLIYQWGMGLIYNQNLYIYISIYLYISIYI